MKTSFIDEDWTGLTHQQIYSQIVAEEEEQQCKSEGHQWIPAFYCRTCGLQSLEALEAFKKKMTKTDSGNDDEEEES